ncbi:YjeF N-terminal domain [Lasallia pustulata]|uniref:Enhancer of mRNA-decapping protein 3 n=1 Tax=Lasallia pustulata TaxID=136370 RepID=A0A1W5D8K4_9LECA|nr:YjeF N-terminal domain [Lasallia pustulata]
MAADFIGLTVLVTLKSPNAARVQGLVANVVGQQLTLRDVTWHASGHRTPSFVVEGSNIADLEVAPDLSSPANVGNHDTNAIPSSTFTHTQGPNYPSSRVLDQRQTLPTGNAKLPAQATKQPIQSYVDPAILSFVKPPNKSNGPPKNWPTGTRPPSSRNIIETPTLAAGIKQAKPPIPTQTKPNVPSSTALPLYNDPGPESGVVVVLTRPFDGLTLDRGAEEADVVEGLADVEGPATKEILNSMGPVPIGRQTAQPLEAPVKYTGKRSRRGARGRSQKEATIQIPMTATHSVQDPDPSPGVIRRGGRPSKGWRQTPLTEPSPSTKIQPSANGFASPQPASKRKSRNLRYKNGEEQNGWATEEATDIQDMGDFDFEGNLSKFDKRGVFDQIRHDDTTADEERLVSFNRLPMRSGTAGGKNLHYTENVLDSPVATGSANWNSEAGDSEDDDAQINSGRSSRRNISRATMRRPPSRKSSAVASSNHQVGGPGLRYSSPHHIGSPNLKANRKVPSITESSNTPKPSLRMSSTGQACPCVSPLQMLEIEQLAISELGMTEDMITENAARGIAELALRVVQQEAEDSSKDLHPASSVMVILAGNHRSGARAIAAGRQLRSHGARVSICVLGIEREDDLVDSVRRQLHIFRKSGGRVIQDSELPRLYTENNALEELLVIEALLSTHVTFDDLKGDDQARYLELKAWASNWSEQMCHIISVDVPSGVDASTGQTLRTDDGVAVEFPADYVISMGAPRLGLLSIGDWATAKLFVADIGISNTAWRKYGTRRRHGIEFGSEWVVGLRYHAGGE